MNDHPTDRQERIAQIAASLQELQAQEQELRNTTSSRDGATCDDRRPSDFYDDLDESVKVYRTEKMCIYRPCTPQYDPERGYAQARFPDDYRLITSVAERHCPDWLGMDDDYSKWRNIRYTDPTTGETIRLQSDEVVAIPLNPLYRVCPHYEAEPHLYEFETATQAERVRHDRLAYDYDQYQIGPAVVVKLHDLQHGQVLSVHPNKATARKESHRLHEQLKPSWIFQYEAVCWDGPSSPQIGQTVALRTQDGSRLARPLDVRHDIEIER